MKLNKATSHALRILVACARSKDDLQKVADLAQEIELTQQNTFKIVHLLSRAGFVEGERGRYGGVRLKRPADTIRVGDVVGAMELSPDRDDDATDAATGGHAHMFDAAFAAFMSVLNQTTIAEMAQVQKPKAVKEKAPRTAKSKPKRSPSAKPRGGVRTSSSV